MCVSNGCLPIQNFVLHLGGGGIHVVVVVGWVPSFGDAIHRNSVLNSASLISYTELSHSISTLSSDCMDCTHYTYFGTQRSLMQLFLRQGIYPYAANVHTQTYMTSVI